MSGIITLIPGDTDPRPEIVNGNERSEENNRSHPAPWPAPVSAGHQLAGTEHNNLLSPATGHGCRVRVLRYEIVKRANCK